MKNIGNGGTDVLVLIFSLLLYVVHVFGSLETQLPTIQWHPQNPLFKEGKCHHDGYTHMYADIGSFVYISCPSISQTNWVSHVYTGRLYENMFIVSKKEFDNCKVEKLSETTRKLLFCNRPSEDVIPSLKLDFQITTSSSAQMSFAVNKTYYFIATSNGLRNGLNNMHGGRCKEGMKLAITICPQGSNCGDDEKRCSGIPKPTVARSPTHPPSTIISKITHPPSTMISKVSMKVDKKLLKNFTRPVPFVPVHGGETAPVKSDDTGAGVNESSTVVFVIGFMAAFLIGFGLGLLAFRVWQKRYPRSSHASSDGSSMSDHSDLFRHNKHPSSDTPNTEINRKFFTVDGFNQSHEFRRLLSTTSSISSNNTIERHSATPIGEYAS